MESDLDWLYWLGWAGVILVLLAAFVREYTQIRREHRQRRTSFIKSRRTPISIR